MVHHRFITWAGALLVAWLAGAAHAETNASDVARRRDATDRVVLELSGMT